MQAETGEPREVQDGPPEGGEVRVPARQVVIACETIDDAYYHLAQGLIDRRGSEYTADRIATLVAWHRADPVTEYEHHRNAAIFEKFAGIFGLDMQDIGAQQTGLSKAEFQARLVAANQQPESL